MKLKIEEKLILRELDLNARGSSIKIGKKLGLNKNYVNSKIKKFEDNDIVTKYYSVINYQKLGYKTFKILIKLNSYDEKIIEKIYNFTCNFESLAFFQVVYSDVDIIMTFNEKNIYDLYETFQKINFKFSKYILKKDIIIVITENFYSLPFVDSKYKPILTLGKNTDNYKLTKLEKDILNHIKFNGKISIVELANKLDKKANSLLYNLKTLENNKVILAYKPKINYKALGYSQYIVLLNLKNITKSLYEDLIKDIRVMTGAIYISERIGDYDLEFEVLCENELDLRNKMNVFTKKYHDNIQNMQSLLILKYLVRK